MMGSQYRHRRTSDPASAFPGLEPGEIAVNTANRQLAVGDANSGTVGAPVVLLGIRLYDVRAKYLTGDLMVRSGIIYRALVDVAPSAFTSAQWEAISGTINPNYVQKIGDTMTGPLVLAADPAAPLEATTKQYSDTKLPKAGGTMTGAIVLPGNPTAPLQASTKQYVDAQVAAKAAVYTSDTPPAGVPDNSLWWESDTGLLFVRYNDGDSTQWVLAMPMPDVSQFVQKAGDTMAGPLTLLGDPTAVLHAAPKQYVDATINARAVRYDAAQGLTAAQQQQGRQNIYAAPFDAMAYTGIQVNGANDVSQSLGDLAIVPTSGIVARMTDCWAVYFSHATAVFSAQRVNPGNFPAVAGFQNALYMSTNGSTSMASLVNGNQAQFRHTIEGYRCLRLGFGTAQAQALSYAFWFYAPISGIIGVRWMSGAVNRSYMQEKAVVAGWNYVTGTVPGDTAATWNIDNTVGLLLDVFVAGKQAAGPTMNAWWSGVDIATPNLTNFYATVSSPCAITGLTIHPGNETPSAARSPFIQRPYDQELLACKRYFYNGVPPMRGVVNVTTPTNISRAGCRHPVPMRAAPTANMTASVYFFDGTSSLQSVAGFSGNFSTVDVLEGEMVVVSAGVAGRPAILLQNNGNINVDARL